MKSLKPRCIVLLSGGLDSTTVLALAKRDFHIFALSFDYGQRHKFARFLNFKRIDSAKISFFLSIPILGAVSLFGFKNLIIEDSVNFTILNLVSIFLSFFISLITIKYFLKYLNKFSLNIFVYYRIFLGLALLILIYL